MATKCSRPSKEGWDRCASFESVMAEGMATKSLRPSKEGLDRRNDVDSRPSKEGLDRRASIEP
eukprot:10758881-Karenia_brevis.AAC.1